MSTQEQNYGMDMVRVKKHDLLEILRKNRDEHRDIFLEALDGYFKAAVEALEERVYAAKKHKKLDLRFGHLVEPIDQTKQYNRVIKMLEMSIADVVDLTQQEFAQYVMDDWNWMDQFLTSNSRYSEKAAVKFSSSSGRAR